MRRDLTDRWWRHSHLILLLCLLALAFALRLYDLMGQSMWSDEGLSLYRARQPLSTILANTITVDRVVTQDANPPFYFLLLHLWRAVAGETVFALRFLGVAAGTLAVPLLYQVGRVAFGRSVGLAAALLLTLSPFHVWQTQVLRNYALLITLNLITVYALLRFILGGERRWLVVWTGASLVGIYTHYFGFFVFAFGLLALAGAGFRRPTTLLRWRRLWLGLGMVLLLVLPAAWLALDRFSAGRQIDFYPVPLPRVAAHAADAFVVGMSRSLTHPWWRVLPAVALALAGVVAAWRQRALVALLLLGYQLVPLGLLLALSIINPLYNGTRHLLIGLPPFLLFVAAAVALPPPRWRRLLLTVGALLLVSQTAWLWQQFHSADLVRDDVRGAARYLSEVARPDDVVVLHDTLIKFTFDYYYDGAAPVVAMPRWGEGNREEVVARLAATGRDAGFVWFLIEPEPRTGFDRTYLREWADDNWYAYVERRFPAMWLRVAVVGYASRLEQVALPPSATEVSAEWDGELRLHGYGLPPRLTAGEEVWMPLYLSRVTEEEKLYTLLLHLRDPQKKEWLLLEDVIGEETVVPAGWPRETLMRYDYRIALPAGLPPGAYEMSLQLVETETGRLLPLADGSAEIAVANVDVVAAPCTAEPASWPPHQPLRAHFGDEMELYGYRQPGSAYRPGHTLAVDLFWCARRRPQADYRLRLQLVDATGEVVAESGGPLTRADQPPTQWPAGALVMGQGEIVIPASSDDEVYTLQLSLLPPDDDEALALGWFLGRRALALDEVTVAAWPMQTKFPKIAVPQRADFGDPPLIELHGYKVGTKEIVRGEMTPLTLFWRAAGTLDDNYAVFVHLVDAADQIFAQADGPPLHGFRPTAGWLPGEALVDERTLVVPETVPPGTYELWVGWYEPESGRRLPASGAAARGDRVLLGTISVVEGQ